ncbi:MAG: transketolase C-terminal domain-containing protein [Candidatus Parvarchaeota archaeon]
MRNRFAKEIEKKIEEGNTYILTGDLGFSVFERIKERFPDKYIDIGLSEQNMIGVAAGMSIAGQNVFVYSIIPFLIYRAFEQVRDDVCYQNLPVRMVGVGAGLAYSDAGFTHQAIEDYGIMKTLPNVTILSPSDPDEVSVLMEQIENVNGPVYLRLSRSGETILHNLHKQIKIGRALRLKKGNDVLIISTGVLLKKAIEVSQMLESRNVSVEILHYHTLKPFDRESLLRSCEGKRLVVTVEEHLINTGIYSDVLQTLNLNSFSIKVIPFGLSEPIKQYSGTREFLLDSFGLGSVEIYNSILSELGEKTEKSL